MKTMKQYYDDNSYQFIDDVIKQRYENKLVNIPATSATSATCNVFDERLVLAL